jgi:hypothetical protein
LKLGKGAVIHVGSCFIAKEIASSQISFSLWQAAANSKWMIFDDKRNAHGSIA